MQESVVKLGVSVNQLEAWRIGVEAGEKAVEKYKKDQEETAPRESRLNAELLKNFGILLAIILALVNAYISKGGM